MKPGTLPLIESLGMMKGLIHANPHCVEAKDYRKVRRKIFQVLKRMGYERARGSSWAESLDMIGGRHE